MKYTSTRGDAPVLGFADTALTGLAVDGGLYVPEQRPSFAPAAVSGFADKPYARVARDVMTPFAGADVPAADLAALIEKSYALFGHPDVAPLREIADGFYLQELFHGPTLAFKDIALQFLGHLFDYLLAQRGEKMTIVGATSGDTGAAAINAFRDKENINIVILYPHDRVSPVQRRQMTTVDAPNVFNVAVDGTFDDCQDIVKSLFADAALRDDYGLAAVNSINWARIMAQIVYYFHAGSRVFAKHGRAPVFAVPTGNFGNVFAGYVAQTMGLPCERLLVATNRNDILHRFFETGRMQVETVAPSLSPSMDIQVSGNFERLLFDIFKRNGSGVTMTMEHFRRGGTFNLDDDVMARLRRIFASGKQDDAATLDTIRKVHAETGIVIDPHTAVGVGAARDYRASRPDDIIVALATAHPAKFPAAIKAALGDAPEPPPALAGLMDLPERVAVLRPDAATVADYIRQAVPC